MWQTVKNIYNLGVKELRGLMRDLFLMLLVIYTFTLQIYTVAMSSSDTISNAAVAVVDEDNSHLSKRLTDALFPPHFLTPVSITHGEIDAKMDNGTYTFVLVFPPNFQRDVEAGRAPAIQLNVDATRMGQAFTGAGYIQQIFSNEMLAFMGKGKAVPTEANVVIRNRFNPNLTGAWFQVIMQLVSSVTMLAIILTGAALIRERERGTLEHLLVMPVTPFEIMTSKVWSMAFVVMVATGVSMLVVVHGILKIPTQGSMTFFMLGLAMHMFAMTSMGIFLACVAQNMPQLGMLLILVLMPLQMLSGGMTPQESMPSGIRLVMQFAPTTHFVTISQSILFRGASLAMVWKPFAWLAGIGTALFAYSLSRFRKSVA